MPPSKRFHNKSKSIAATHDDLRYCRFTEDTKDVTRGTAVFDHVSVHGYPHIGRLVALQPGLAEQFSAPFWVEEKVDGFNVRIFRIQDRLIALSRGGFVCPFSTDRIPDLLDPAIFDREPDLVVCGEIAGPENPYAENAPPFVPEDVRLFVFDLMRFNQTEFLPQDEKIRLIKHYKLPSVKIYGRFEVGDIDEIRGILRRVNDEYREGVVFKEESSRNHRAKYVTYNSSISDIRVNAYNLMELPPEYFTSRILRLVLFLEEQGLGRPEGINECVGAAFLDGLLEAIKRFRDQKKVYWTFRCRFRERGNAEKLMEHLRKVKRHVQIIQRDLRQEQGYWILEFDRVYPSLTGLLSHTLGGGLVYD